MTNALQPHVKNESWIMRHVPTRQIYSAGGVSGQVEQATPPPPFAIDPTGSAPKNARACVPIHALPLALVQ